MKSKAILVFLIAILAITVMPLLASAVQIGSLAVNIDTVSIKGVDTIAQTISGEAGETIPLRVVFTANEDISDVKVRMYISGYREFISESTKRTKVFNGTTYSELLSLKLPSDINPSEDYTLYVRVETKTGYAEESYKLKVQRESYNLEVLNAEVARSATAGSTLNVDVVLKNRGIENLDDSFVIVRIPALGVEKKAYFGDMAPTDLCNDCDKQDVSERTLSIKIPSDAKAGIYTLEIEAYNGDSTVTTTKSIVVTGSEQISEVLTAVTGKEVAAGSTATYDLVIINSGDRIAVYEIVPETAQNLIVSVDEPIVTVPADSSRIVKVNAKAGEVTGTFNFAVNVNSQDKLVKRVNLSANVTKASVASNVVILTIVLAIVFIVLLIVLIVLLTRKPEKVEEFGESYY